MIIFLYFILFIVLSKKYIYLLVSLNLITWFVNFDFINVKYKYDNICDPLNSECKNRSQIQRVIFMSL